MTTLTEFLLARITEDEALARSVADGGSGKWESWNRSWDVDPFRDIAVDGERVATVPATLDEFICTHDPARVLAECEAKRRIVELHHTVDGAEDPDAFCWTCDDEGWPCGTMAALALPYSDHPEYREEWRPPAHNPA